MFMTRARFDHALKISALDAVNEERKRVSDIHNKCEANRLESLVGNLVIVVSNEPSNVMVAFAKGVDFITQAQSPVLVVQDLVTKKEYIAFGKTFLYTKQKFDALNSLEPNARIAILFDSYLEGDVKKVLPENILTPEEWKNKVEESIKIWFRENEH